jgi:hypothetical protein
LVLIVGCTPPGSKASESSDSSEATSEADASSSSNEDGTEDEGTSNFVSAFDLPPESCNNLSTEDCPTGEKCAAVAVYEYRWDSNICVPILGEDVPGDACQAVGENPFYDGLDTCENGSMCWPDDWSPPDAEQGHCIAHCQGYSLNDPTCPGDTVCNYSGDGVLNICLEPCDPLAPADGQCSNPKALCMRNDRILPIGGRYTCISPGGVAGYGEACSFDASCAWGMACSLSGKHGSPACDDECCTLLCDLGQPNTCPDAASGQTCRPYEHPLEGYEHVGYCGIL